MSVHSSRARSAGKQRAVVFPAEIMAGVWPRRNEAPSKVKGFYRPIPGSPGHGPRSASPEIILLYE